MKSNKRPQAPKARANKPYMHAMQGLRQSNAATPHRNKTRYNRKSADWKREV